MSLENSFATSSRHRLSSTLINASSSPGPTAFNSSRYIPNDDSQLLSDDLEIDGLGIGDDDEQILDTLTRHWMNERNAPEVLSWQGSLVETVLDRLHAQVRSVLCSVFFPRLVRRFFAGGRDPSAEKDVDQLTDLSSSEINHRPFSIPCRRLLFFHTRVCPPTSRPLMRHLTAGG